MVHVSRCRGRVSATTTCTVGFVVRLSKFL